MNDPSYHKTSCRKDLVPDHKGCTGICQQCLSLRHSTRLPRVPSGHRRNLCRRQSSPGPGRSSCRWRLPPGSRSYPPPPPPARQTAGSASSGAECFPPLQMRKLWTRSNRPKKFHKNMILPQRKPPLTKKRDPCLYLSNDKNNGKTSKRYQESTPSQLPKKEGWQGHDGRAVLRASLQVTGQ